MIARTAPTLETERLRLRAHVRDDFEFVARMWAEPDVVRFIGEGRPLTRDEAWAKLQRMVGHWPLVGYGFWAIQERAKGALVGECGFIDRNLAPDQPFAGVPEIGWALAPGETGKGYAAEAIAAALAWGRQALGPIRVIAVIQSENTPSIRVAERFGFSQCARAEACARTLLYFERTL